MANTNLDFFAGLEDIAPQPEVKETKVKDEVTNLDKVVVEEEIKVPDFTEFESKEEEIETKSDDTNEDSNIFSVYFEDLKEKEFLDLPEDFEFKGTEDSLKEAITLSKERMREKEKEDLVSSFQEFVYQNLDAIQNTYTGVDFENIDLTDESVQKDVVRYYLKKTTKFKDEQIEKKINQYEQFAELEEEAKANLEELKKIDVEEKAEVAKQAVEYEKARKKAQKDADALFQKTLKEMDEVSGIKVNKDKVFQSLYKPVKLEDGTVTNSFNIKLQEALTDPKKVIFLAHLLENNLELEKIEEAQVATKAAKTLKQKLADAQKSSAAKIKAFDSDKPGKTSLSDFI